MTLDRLRELVESVLNGESGGLALQEGGVLLTVALHPSDGPAAEPDTILAFADADTIVSSMFGQLHTQGEPGAQPFVSVGQMVEAGQRVALLEAMKAFCPVVTTRAGRIVEILVEHGAEVAAGQPLFRVA